MDPNATSARALSRAVEANWPTARQFFERAERELSAPQSVAFRAVYASVPRRLGGLADAPVVASEVSAARPHWTLADYTRAWLVARACQALPRERRAAFHLALFEAGEMGEQLSLLRTLSVLEESSAFLDTALAACRTNTRSVFEAIVCENAFVAEHFPTHGFNQAVLKAIFMEVSVHRIEGLEARLTPELGRMAAAYRSERLAAGRQVPVDIEYLMKHGV
jgi:hypothetical protein